MRFGGIIACRLDSQRLPGKSLSKIGGRPLLAYVVERCRKIVELGGQLVVATTSRPLDDPIAGFCAKVGYPLFRGDANDVAGRFLTCAREFGFDWFYRLNGDSPFVEPQLLFQGWEAASTGRYDFITNLHPRSYPYGVSLELIRTDVFETAYREMRDPLDLEHVTRALYRNIEDFRYYNLTREGRDLSALHLTVDTPEDLALFSQAVQFFGDRWGEVSYLEAVAFYEQARATL